MRCSALRRLGRVNSKLMNYVIPHTSSVFVHLPFYLSHVLDPIDLPRRPRPKRRPLLRTQASSLHPSPHHPPPIPPRELVPSSTQVTHRPITSKHDPFRPKSIDHRIDILADEFRYSLHSREPFFGGVGGLLGVWRERNDFGEAAGDLHVYVGKGGEGADVGFPV